jgi:hypothetical protein
MAIAKIIIKIILLPSGFAESYLTTSHRFLKTKSGCSTFEKGTQTLVERDIE